MSTRKKDPTQITRPTDLRNNLDNLPLSGSLVHEGFLYLQEGSVEDTRQKSTPSHSMKNSRGIAYNGYPYKKPERRRIKDKILFVAE